MRGADIPLVTCYVITPTGTKKYKRPEYVLESAEVIKAKQDKLGKNAAWYYGTHCKKCCGVYPAFMTENTFEAKGYYICLVCGKEGAHESMAWIAAESWNKGLYEWIPEKGLYEQMSLFDYEEFKCNERI